MNTAADILARVQAAGIRLEPLPDGRIKVAPRSRLTDELRSLIVEHKVELIAALEIRPDPAAEAHRQRVLAMLAERPGVRYAVLTDTSADPDNVIVALAIRGVGTCELRIPRTKYDGVLLLDLIEKHSGTVH